MSLVLFFSPDRLFSKSVLGSSTATWLLDHFYSIEEGRGLPQLCSKYWRYLKISGYGCSYIIGPLWTLDLKLEAHKMECSNYILQNILPFAAARKVIQVTFGVKGYGEWRCPFLYHVLRRSIWLLDLSSGHMLPNTCKYWVYSPSVAETATEREHWQIEYYWDMGRVGVPSQSHCHFALKVSVTLRGCNFLWG